MTTTGLPAESTEAATAEVVGSLVPAWLQFPGHRLVAALLVVALGVSLSKLLVSLLGRPVARRFERQSVAQIVLGGIRSATIAVTLIIAGSIVGLRLGNIVLSVTVFSAVVGIVLAPIVGNVLNGIFVLADQPFEIGDMIELDDGTRGFVDDITIRYTKIFTLDNTFLVIPNGNVRDRDVTNYSAEDERTRLSLNVLVTYDSDITEARRQMELAARDTDDVIKGGPDIRVGSARYPASPGCFIADFADSGVLLQLRYWVTKPYKIVTVESAVRTAIRQRFIDADGTLEMAYPHRQLVFADGQQPDFNAPGSAGPPAVDTQQPVDDITADDRSADDTTADNHPIDSDE